MRYVGYTPLIDLADYEKDGFIRVRISRCVDQHEEFTEKVEFNTMYSHYDPNHDSYKRATDEEFNANHIVIVEEFREV